MPQECLIRLMQQNQKRPAPPTATRGCARFLLVSNLATEGPGRRRRRQQRVLRARGSPTRSSSTT
ncbi:MAG: hypothetical protein IPG84_12310 [Betaproteobacteria bacterium]|nr:hypothetical protein [Betaproteobacteria bacterium]